METLGQIGRSDQGGVLRVAFRQTDMAGRRWMAEQFSALGLTLTPFLGNLYIVGIGDKMIYCQPQQPPPFF